MMKNPTKTAPCSPVNSPIRSRSRSWGRLLARPLPRRVIATAFLILLPAASGREVSYQYYRFDPQRMRGDGRENSVQLAEFEVRLDGATVSGATATNPGGDNPDGPQFIQTPDKAIDGDLNSKWLDFNKQALVLDFGQPVTIDAIRFATGGDVPDRDPVAWTVSGSQDGSTWEPLLVEGYDLPPIDRNTFTEEYPIPEALEIVNERPGVRVVAASGDPIPESSASYLSIARAQINNAGEVLLQGGFDYEGGEIPSATALIRWQDGISETIAIQDEAGDEKQFFTEYAEGRLNNDGDILLFTRSEDTLEPIDEYDQAEDERVLLLAGSDPSQRVEVIREGRTEAPPGSGFLLRSLVGAATNFENRPLFTSYRLTDQGQLIFAGTSENESGEITRGIHSADGTSLTTIVTEGDPTPIPDTTFTFIQTDVNEPDGLTDVNAGGQVVFIAPFDGPDVDFSDDQGVFLFTPGDGISLLARGDDDDRTGDHFERPYAAELTDDGKVFFQAANARSLKREIWGDPEGDGTYRPVIREGIEVPADLGYGENAEFGEPAETSLTNSGKIVFWCDVFEVGQLSSTYLATGLFLWEDGQVTNEFLTTETTFASLGGGTIDSGSLLANREGDVVINARIDGPVDAAIIGIPNASSPQVLVTEGSYVGGLNPEGDTVVEIVGFDLEPFSSQVYDTSFRLLNDNGQLLVPANLGSGGRAILGLTLEESSPVLTIPEFSFNRATQTVTFELSGEPDTSVTIQSNTSLNPGWTALETLQLDSSGNARTSVPLDPAPKRLFFRTIRTN